jgi:hypothetical protein
VHREVKQLRRHIIDQRCVEVLLGRHRFNTTTSTPWATTWHMPMDYRNSNNNSNSTTNEIALLLAECHLEVVVQEEVQWVEEAACNMRHSRNKCHRKRNNQCNRFNNRRNRLAQWLHQELQEVDGVEWAGEAARSKWPTTPYR